MRHLALLVGTALMSLMLGTAPAAHAAAPLEHQNLSFEDSYLECGYESSSTYSVSNLLLDSNPSTEGQFFRFSYTWQGTTVITNPLTGAYVTINGHGVYKEIQPRSYGSGLFTYVEHNVGTFVLRGASGNELLRQAGRLAFTYLFDSLRDSEPGGDQLVATLLRVSGPHPEFEGEVDFCELLDSAIG